MTALAALPLAGGWAGAAAAPARLQSWPLNTPGRTGIHDVAPAPDGGVWFTAQASGHLGWFDPKSARTELISLGRGSAPHGVIQGPDKAAWITDGGQNAIVRVGWPDRSVRAFPLPVGSAWANLNTCAFDGDGELWFTGQSGVVGKVAVKTGAVTVKDAPRGRGPYGICATPTGDIWWCSLASSFIAKIAWRTWKLPGKAPRCYAVYVDERDIVWASDWGSNAVWRFDPASEAFEHNAFPREAASVRQILGRPGEVWLPESGTEHISVIRTA